MTLTYFSKVTRSNLLQTLLPLLNHHVNKTVCKLMTLTFVDIDFYKVTKAKWIVTIVANAGSVPHVKFMSIIHLGMVEEASRKSLTLAYLVTVSRLVQKTGLCSYKFPGSRPAVAEKLF